MVQEGNGPRTPVRVSIVVPARNEGHRLPGTIHALDGFVATRPGTDVVLAIDIASSDETVAIAEESERTRDHLHVVEVTSQGKGHAVVIGVRAAEGEIIVMADTDLAV